MPWAMTPACVWSDALANSRRTQKAEKKVPEEHGLPPYPVGNVVGPCVCGSWPGGACLQCEVITGAGAAG